MDKILAVGADRWLQKAQVSTYIGNDTATATYEKAGFRVETKRSAQEFQALLGVPGLVTMRGDMRAVRSLSGWASRTKFQVALHMSYPLTTMPIAW
jgi:hypothetical protein